MGFFVRKALLAAVVAVSLFYHAAALATNFTSVEYDEESDKLIVVIAYRGTHDGHQFSVQWGECRPLDDERSQIYGLLVDSDPMDRAHQEFVHRLEIDMSTFSCRPARVTLRTAAGFNRSIDVPAPKKPK